jgi:hypothetical protein
MDTLIRGLDSDDDEVGSKRRTMPGGLDPQLQSPH